MATDNYIEWKEGDRQLVRSALGKTAFLGELYNARDDSFTTASLFNSKFPVELIYSPHTSNSVIDYCFSDKLSEKLNKLKVEADLQLSICLGTVQLTGSGQYLQLEKKSEQTISYSLLYKVSTCCEKLKLSFSELDPFIDKNVFFDRQYTHVVSAINWGANIAFNFERIASDSRNTMEVKGELKAFVEKFGSTIKGGAKVDGKYEDLNNATAENVRVKFFGDVVPNDGIPTTPEAAFNFIKKLPELLKLNNDGKGNALSYVLTPISTFKTYYKMDVQITQMITTIDQSFVKSLVYFFDDLNVREQKINNLLALLTEFEIYLPDTSLSKIRIKQRDFDITVSHFKGEIAKNLPKLRAGQVVLIEVSEIVDRYKEFELNLKTLDDFIREFEPVMTKIEQIKNCFKNNIRYLPKNEKFDNLIDDNVDKNLHVLFTSESFKLKNAKLHRENFQLFRQMAKNHQEVCLYFVVDFDIHPNLLSSYDSESKLRIVQYKDGKIVSKNTNNLEDSVKNKIASNFRELKLRNDLNILLLGQSGVGKSTWINSIANYLSYETFQEARKGGVVCVIPTTFTVSNGNAEKQSVSVGGVDSNEAQTDGKLRTQKPRTYSYDMSDFRIRIIDTPGLGAIDTDTDRDRENMKLILDHISHLKDIHCICILMKQNHTKMTANFKFCVKEILTHFHKSAARNIIFCFTNSRSSSYSPGDTSAVLNRLLRENHLNDLISLTRNTFCLDNEAFRFLCTLRYPSLSFLSRSTEIFEGSWEKSVSETKRLFDKIKELPPHRVTDSLTLCSIRHRIIKLEKSVAEISQSILINFSAISDQEEKKEKIEGISEMIIKSFASNRTCNNSECLELRDLIEINQVNMYMIQDEMKEQLKILTIQNEKYNEEKEKVMEICKKFGAFLKENAIVPYNDDLGHYLAQEIVFEDEMKKEKTISSYNSRSLGVDDDQSSYLKVMMRRYEEEVRILDESMKSNGKNTIPLTMKNILDLERELYSLELTGKQIKKDMESITKFNEFSRTYYEKLITIEKYRHEIP